MTKKAISMKTDILSCTYPVSIYGAHHSKNTALQAILKVNVP